jgi:hypothetical protein
MGQVQHARQFRHIRLHGGQFTTVEFQTDVGTVIATPIPGTQRSDDSYQVILSMSVAGAPTQTVRVTNDTLQQAVADYASNVRSSS